ncbi:MAG: ATP-dependent 6-phosphofructokinase [Spirochaetia bacterium]
MYIEKDLPKPEELEIESIGSTEIESPLGLSTVYGDNVANYVEDDATVLYHTDSEIVMKQIEEHGKPLAFEKAGPRHKIHFDPKKTTAAIVTCGGLCPGINNVIRSLVMTLHYRYGVKNILGAQYGYQGFVDDYEMDFVKLTPEQVKEIHTKGGTILGSSRGHQDIKVIVDKMEEKNINILFTIGGDGTLRGSHKIYEEVTRRGLDVSIIGVPKTIDNDISYVEKTFGLETAFSVAAEAIQGAHTEAIGAPNGIGIVKVMGRMSGFIAANSALGLNEVNYVLIPEIPFELEGKNGLFENLEQRLKTRKHAVIVVAEGAGQDLVAKQNTEFDASGNRRLMDIGVFLKEEIKNYFKNIKKMEVNVKYIDPSYMVRSVPANANDAIFCLKLAQNAVHAAMAGKTGMIVGRWNYQFTHVPIKIAISKRKEISPEDPLWLSVIESTGQPMKMRSE